MGTLVNAINELGLSLVVSYRGEGRPDRMVWGQVLHVRSTPSGSSAPPVLMVEKAQSSDGWSQGMEIPVDRLAGFETTVLEVSSSPST